MQPSLAKASETSTFCQSIWWQWIQCATVTIHITANATSKATTMQQRKRQKRANVWGDTRIYNICYTHPVTMAFGRQNLLNMNIHFVIYFCSLSIGDTTLFQYFQPMPTISKVYQPERRHLINARSIKIENSIGMHQISGCFAKIYDRWT